MKKDDHLLPPKLRARLEVTETLLAICKAGQRNPDPAMVVAFSECRETLQRTHNDFRAEADALKKGDRRDAGMAIMAAADR